VFLINATTLFISGVFLAKNFREQSAESFFISSHKATKGIKYAKFFILTTFNSINTPLTPLSRGERKPVAANDSPF
jgi:hypothetical protein